MTDVFRAKAIFGLRVVFLGLLAGVAHAVPPCRYTVETIVGPPCGPNDNAHIRVRAINEAGHVVGAYECPGGQPRPFKWSPEGGFQALPLPPGYPNGVAVDIADDGVILGTTAPITSPSTGYLWDGQSFQVFGTMPGGFFSDAAAMNNDHLATGFWGNSGSGPGEAAFRWNAGVMENVASDLIFGGSRAFDISENGLITGYMGGTTFPPNYRAFIWNNGKVTDLGLRLPGALASEARAVTNKGEACGIWHQKTDSAPGYRVRGFHWDGEVMTDLFSGLNPGAIALDMNVSNQIIGHFLGPYPQGGPPVVWDDHRPYPIQSLMDTALPLSLQAAVAINGAGQIACDGFLYPTGPDVGVLLTPVWPAAGDTNCDDIVNVDDLLGVISHWSADGGREDMNDDGVVNALDLIDVIVNWD